MESTLVVVIAETRAHEYSFPSFRANVLEALNADLALCIAKNQWEDTSNPFYQHARYIWTYEEPDDWGSAFDAAQIVEGCQGDWRCLLDLDGIWMGEFTTQTAEREAQAQFFSSSDGCSSNRSKIVVPTKSMIASSSLALTIST